MPPCDQSVEEINNRKVFINIRVGIRSLFFETPSLIQNCTNKTLPFYLIISSADFSFVALPVPSSQPFFFGIDFAFCFFSFEPYVNFFFINDKVFNYQHDRNGQ